LDLKYVTTVVQIFKDATLFFSRGTPNLATVIPAMDHIDQHLATASLNRTYGPAVRVALSIGKATLNRYYNLTDASEVYRIAMSKYAYSLMFSLVLMLVLVLHPRHKLQYFKNAKWEQDWIDTAQQIVNDEYLRSYAPNEAAPSQNNDSDVDMHVSMLVMSPLSVLIGTGLGKHF
jgi:hypothetical protein